MFSKSFIVSAVLLAFSAQVSAHAGVTPALGVSGTFERSNVQRPSANAECGSINVAATLGTSTPVVADANGNFDVTATNFNGGQDGSRQFTLKVDPTGTGKSFVAGTISKNGDLAPTTVGSLPIVAALPAGTKCTGGASKDLCLASFTSAGGFGNCVVVKQNAASTGNAAAAAATKATGNASSAAAKVATAKAANNNNQAATAAKKAGKKGKGKGKKGKKGKKGAKKAAAAATAATATAAADVVEAAAPPLPTANIEADLEFAETEEHRRSFIPAGTRAARAALHEIEVRGEDVFNKAKRSFMSWIWA